MATVVKHYDSIAALCAAQPSEANAGVWAEVVSNGEFKHSEWFGVDTRAETIRVVERGWEDGVARLFAGIGNIDAKRGKVPRRRRVRSDFGDELDIQRVYRGQVDTAWARTRRVQVEATRVVRIIMQVGALSFVASEEMFWRGAACAVIADALENAGNRVEIVGYSSASGVVKSNNASMTITFPIKAAEQPLDLAALASTACLAGFHRHYIFKARCSHHSRIAGGMGSTKVGVPASLAEEGAIHVSLDSVNSVQSAINFVRAHLGEAEPLAA